MVTFLVEATGREIIVDARHPFEIRDTLHEIRV